MKIECSKEERKELEKFLDNQFPLICREKFDDCEIVVDTFVRRVQRLEDHTWFVECDVFHGYMDDVLFEWDWSTYLVWIVRDNGGWKRMLRYVHLPLENTGKRYPDNHWKEEYVAFSDY